MCSGLSPVPHSQSHASTGRGAFFEMDDLDPIAIYVLFEKWDPQTESSQDDQAGVCLGPALCSHGSETQSPLTRAQQLGDFYCFTGCPSWGSWAEEDL